MKKEMIGVYSLIMRRFSTILLMLGCMMFARGEGNRYISMDGDNSGPGTQATPFRTIEHALGFLGPGDTLFIRAGTYHEEIVMSNIAGTAVAPVVISSFPGEEVRLGGTRPIETPWSIHEGSIYKTTIDQDIWQLFVEKQMLMPARWPNAFLEDGSVWDRERNWGHGNEGPAENGIFVDAPHGNVSLSASGIDATGAMAILNIGSWKTWSRDVLSHSSGTSSFTYTPVPAYKDKHHYYFLEGKLELLDAPGEWYYDKDSKELFLWMPDGSVPDERVSGKDQSFVFSFEKFSHVKIQGLDFFATTFYFKNCKDMTVEDCNLQFASCSKRALGNHGEPDVSTMFNANTYEPTRNKLINCNITYTESQALSFKGHSNLVENCNFYGIDWTVANRPGLMNSIYNQGENNIFRRNSVELTGASSTLYPGNFPVVELNRITRTGFLQSDGSITQLTIGAQPNSQTRFNWFHNTVKSGARFDAPIPPTVWGQGGTMRHNVVWETNIGLMQKGEYHYCYHNTVLLCEQNGIVILDDAAEGGGGSKGTITRNNFSDRLSGHRSEYVKVPGEADHNWNAYTSGTDFREQVYDYQNLDFRPRWNSALVDAGVQVSQVNQDYMGMAPDIGAYEFGDTLYWIGGRQLEKASTPIPGNKGTTTYEFVDLMWLDGYRSLSNDIYFGNSAGAMESAGHGSVEFMGNQAGNIFSPGALVAGQTYYWRVDAVRPGGITRGDVWSFKAGVNANPEVHTATFMVYGKKDGTITPLESVVILIGERASKTGAYGKARITMLPEGGLKYKLSKKGFESISDSIYLSSDTLLTDTLDHVSYAVVFDLRDADSGMPLSGAEINFGNDTVLTDQDGKGSLSDIEYAWYELGVSADGYFPMDTELVEVYSDTTLRLTLEKQYLNVSFRVFDLTSGLPVKRAFITYKNMLKLTNSSGEAVLDKIPVGYLTYSITHDDYIQLIDSSMINSDTVLELNLIPRLANIQFEVSGEEGPLEGVQVELDGFLSLYTDSEGFAEFIYVQAAEEHTFALSREGYEFLFDSLFLEVDTVVAITMQKFTGTEGFDQSGLILYPNPGNDLIYLKAPAVPGVYSITSPEGKVVMNGKISEEVHRIELTGLPAGIYLIRVFAGLEVFSNRIVIN